jgi:hypothetical protein
VTSRGHRCAELQRALKNGNLWVAEAAAREMPVSLEHATLDLGVSDAAIGDTVLVVGSVADAVVEVSELAAWFEEKELEVLVRLGSSWITS